MSVSAMAAYAGAQHYANNAHMPIGSPPLGTSSVVEQSLDQLLFTTSWTTVTLVLRLNTGVIRGSRGKAKRNRRSLSLQGFLLSSMPIMTVFRLIDG